MKMYYDEKLNDYIIDAGTPNYKVTEVQANDDYTLLLTFVTGEKKIFDFKPLLEEYPFQPLKNKRLFKKAFICCGIAWNDEIDIDSEYLYENGVLVE